MQIINALDVYLPELAQTIEKTEQTRSEITSEQVDSI
jgi:hypothetical protein